HRPLRTLLIAGSASIGAGLLVAACSGTAGQGSAGGTTNGSAHRALSEPVAGAAPMPSGRAARSGTFTGSSGKLARLVLPAQSIIYTANLSVRVSKSDSVTAAATHATSIVTAVGGYVSGEQEIIPPGGHSAPQINLELKIPVAQYGPTLAKLKELGKQ